MTNNSVNTVILSAGERSFAFGQDDNDENVLSFSKHGKEWSLQERTHPNVVRMVRAYQPDDQNKFERVSLYA